MDDIKLFAIHEKELETLLQVVWIYNQDIGMEFGMMRSNNDKQKTTNDGANITTISRKNQNTRTKGNLQILGNTGSGNDQTSGDEKKKTKMEYLRTTRKLVKTKLHSRNLKAINTWTVPPCKIIGTILIRDEGRTSTNGPEKKIIVVHETLDHRDERGTICVQKRRRERTHQHWR